jgi:HSP20 family protein
LQRWLPLVSCQRQERAKVAELPEPALTILGREGIVMTETSVASPRSEEKRVAITPVQNLMDWINKTSQAIAQRAYEIFEGSGRRFGHDLEDWFKAEMDLLHQVPVNIVESDENLEVKAEVPGFTEKEIQISVEPRRLTITGKREASKEEKKGKAVYSEFSSDQILRVLDLPASVDAEKVTATLKNGVVRLIMPKTAKAKAIEIKPKVA